MPARRIDEVVTIAAMERVAKQINTGMGQLLRQPPQAPDQAETERRMSVIQETVGKSGADAPIRSVRVRPQNAELVHRPLGHA